MRAIPYMIVSNRPGESIRGDDYKELSLISSLMSVNSPISPCRLTRGSYTVLHILLFRFLTSASISNDDYK